jgi:glucose/arabinose dehydrogenase
MLAPIAGLTVGMATGLRAAELVSDGGLPTVKMVPAFAHLEFDRPVFLTHPPGQSDRLFVAGQNGIIHVFPNRQDVKNAEVFLDLTKKVISYEVPGGNEEGLLGLAFHPEYEKNGYFYTYYTTANPRRAVLSRFTVSTGDPDRADPASEQILLEVGQPFANHNGATALFGPDGFLYVSYGDGGAAKDPFNNGQNLKNLLGTIIRIDVNGSHEGKPYGIPKDNPFVGRPGARPEIYAYGLRNVWRMSFDPATGDLWAGDVGQDLYEEINIIKKGGNYGWNIREGFRPFKGGRAEDPLLDPVIVYGRADGLSVTGGYVYRGNRVESLKGAYVYADYVLGRFWALRYENGEVTALKEILKQPKNIGSFSEAPDGELYVLAFDGRLYNLEEE